MGSFPLKSSTLALLLTLLAAASGRADTVSVPITGHKAPAADLVYKGSPIDPDEALDLSERGTDISLLDPVPNDLWKPLNPGKPQTPPPAENFPEDGVSLDFTAFYAGAPGLFRAQVQTAPKNKNEKPRPFRLAISLGSHRALLAVHLMRKLGYNQPLPKRYKQLTLRFASVEARETFLESVADRSLKNRETWISSLPEKEPYVVLKDVLLESPRIDIGTYYWSAFTASNVQGRRSIRALALPLSLLNVSENINYYRWDWAQTFSEALVLTYPDIDPQTRPFAETSLDDLKWIGRKIAKMSEKELRDLVALGEYPADIAAQVSEKLISRRNQMVVALGLERELPEKQRVLPFNMKLNNPSVKDGKVIVCEFPGYASRFCYGDPADPMSGKELGYYAMMRSLTAGMDALMTKLNEKLVVIGADRWVEQHQKNVIKDIIKHIQTNPGAPYEQPVQVFHGPLLSGNVSTSRHVTTGTYYGSDARIQLVDSLSISAQLGYFLGIDGVPKMIPGVTGNAAISRSYTHVRGMDTMEAAAKADQSFIVPIFLHKLTKVLGDEDEPQDPNQPIDTEIQKKKIEARKKAVQNLLKELEEGDMLSVTDTVTAGLGVQVMLPINALMPSAPVGYNQNLGVNARSQGVILRRTTYTRTKHGLQIYIQKLDTAEGNVSLDVNWWLNILKVSGAGKVGKANTEAYVINTEGKGSDEENSKLLLALRSLFKTNDKEALRQNFSPYLLRHDLSSTSSQGKFLFLRSYKIEESHRLRVQPPADPKNGVKPEEHERTLFSFRKLTRTGFNFAGLISDIVDSWTKNSVTIERSESGNPAYTPYGSAEWTQISTEIETTPGAKTKPVTLTETYWAGWTINKENLFKIFDVIDSNIQSLKLSMPLIHREHFNNTQKVRFYEVRSTLIYYEKGMERLKSLFLDKKGSRAYRPSFLEKFTQDEFSPGDKELVERMIGWIGKKQFEWKCRELVQSRHPHIGNDNPGIEVLKGNTYTCLLPWMRDLLDLRRAYPENPEEQAKWNTRLVSLLQENVDLAPMLEVVGKDGYFFNVKVSGFRVNDEDGDTTYVSDSIGTYDQFAGAGPFRDVAEGMGPDGKPRSLMMYEIYARYFSEGG